MPDGGGRQPSGLLTAEARRRVMVRVGWFRAAFAWRISGQEGVETVDFGIEAISFAAGSDEFIDQSGALSLIFLWGDRFWNHDFSGAAGAVHFGGFAQGGEPRFAIDGGGGEAGAGSST